MTTMSEREKQAFLDYCANGRKPDGSPDPMEYQRRMAQQQLFTAALRIGMELAYLGRYVPPTLEAAAAASTSVEYEVLVPFGAVTT